MENIEEMQTTTQTANTTTSLPEGRLNRKLLNDLKYKCETKGCREKFRSHDELNDHKEEHSRTRPFGCKFCTATFTQSSNLKRHEKMHKGLKPYDCTTCNRKFTSSSNLKQHLATHNSRVDRKKARCLVCSREYMYKCSLIKHIKDDHHITTDPAKHIAIIDAEEAVDEERSTEIEPTPAKKIFVDTTTVPPQYQNPLVQPVVVQIPITNQLMKLQAMPVQPTITVQPTIPMQTSNIPMNLPLDTSMLRQSQQNHSCNFVRVKDYLNFISAQQRVAMAQNLMKMYSVQKVLPPVYAQGQGELKNTSELPKAEEFEQNQPDSNMQLAFTKSQKENRLDLDSSILKKEEC